MPTSMSTSHHWGVYCKGVQGCVYLRNRLEPCYTKYIGTFHEFWMIENSLIRAESASGLTPNSQSSTHASKVS